MPGYRTTAALLGIGWFIVLLIPSTTREWLLSDVPFNAAFLVVTSVTVAVMLRNFIERADTFSQQLLRAALVPLAGCLVFLTFCAILMWVRSIVFGGLANVHDTLSLYMMGTIAAASSFFIVIPYGLLCQYCLQYVINRRAD